MPTCSLAWSHVPTCKDQSDQHAHKLPTCWIAHQPIPSASYVRILRLVADLPCPVISLRHLRLWRLTTSHLHLMDVKFTLERKTGAGDGLKRPRETRRREAMVPAKALAKKSWTTKKISLAPLEQKRASSPGTFLKAHFFLKTERHTTQKGEERGDGRSSAEILPPRKKTTAFLWLKRALWTTKKGDNIRTRG